MRGFGIMSNSIGAKDVPRLTFDVFWNHVKQHKCKKKKYVQKTINKNKNNLK